MKLKYILITLLASLILFGCEKQQFKTQLDEVQVSSSYIGIPVSGGKTEITLTAVDSWQINGIPSWLTVTPASGSAGETKVTFSANPTLDNNSATLTLVCGAGEQLINIVQGVGELPVTPVKDITIEGKTYRAEGTVTGIYNTQYGNWYLVDDNGNSITIYGTLDAKGATKNFLSLGISNGDRVIVEGPYTLYAGTTPELIDVTVIKHTPSLIKVVSDPISLEIEGGAFDIELESKGKGISIDIPEDAKSWLQVVGINQNGNTAVVSFVASANDGGDRNTTLVFSTNNGAYTAETSVSQVGAIIETTADVINAAADGTVIYRITGYVSSIANTTYGNLYIADATGEVYVYGTLDAKGATKNFSSLGIKAGDIVTVIGPKSSYNGKAQMVNVTVEKHISVAEISVTDFLNKEVGSDYFQMTGTVSNIKNTTYGNFDIEDETGKVYVYGLAPGYDAFKKYNKAFASIGINEGDKIVIVGQRGAYSGTAQVGAAFFVKKLAAPVEPVGNMLTVTADVLPTAYPASEETITSDGIQYKIFNLANYGSGLQFKKKDGDKSGGYITNVTEIKNIKKIKLTWRADKTFYPANLAVSSGSKTFTAKVDETAKTMEYDLSDGTYTQFKVENPSGYAAYLEKIEISYE